NDERNAIESVYDPNGNVRCTLETEFGADRERAAGSQKLSKQLFRTDFQYDYLNRLLKTRTVGRVSAAQSACPPTFDDAPFKGLDYITTMAYDSRGNLFRMTDPANGRTKSFYDGLNRLLRTEAGYVLSGTTDIVSPNMMNTSNPDGKVTTAYTYDANSRVI